MIAEGSTEISAAASQSKYYIPEDVKSQVSAFVSVTYCDIMC
jgi:hypothetical protein